METEYFKANHANSLAEYQAKATLQVEMFRSVIASGQNAMKSATLINGGAAVALLAFIGHVWEKDLSTAAATGLTEALALFLVGVLCSTVATGTTYLTQAFYAESWDKLGSIVNLASIFLVVASYLLFAFGGYRAYLTFLMQLR